VNDAGISKLLECFQDSLPFSCMCFFVLCAITFLITFLHPKDAQGHKLFMACCLWLLSSTECENVQSLDLKPEAYLSTIDDSMFTDEPARSA